MCCSETSQEQFVLTFTLLKASYLWPYCISLVWMLQEPSTSTHLLLAAMTSAWVTVWKTVSISSVGSTRSCLRCSRPFWACWRFVYLNAACFLRLRRCWVWIRWELEDVFILGNVCAVLWLWKIPSVCWRMFRTVKGNHNQFGYYLHNSTEYPLTVLNILQWTDGSPS